MTDDDAASKILVKLDDLSREIKVLRSDVAKTKSDMTFVNLRMQSVEDGNKAIQTDTADIKSDLRRLEPYFTQSEAGTV